MIGGGDQIYSDGITEPHAPLFPWAQELSPHKRSKIPFPIELRYGFLLICRVMH